LAGVEDVPWSTLTHAYGPASDVPELLMGLVSADVEAREHALHELFGSIWHQGTVYEATAYAVPFLARIAADPEQSGRASVVQLLAAIAGGLGYLEVHRWLIDPDESDRDLDTQEQAETTWVRSARDAVRAQLQILLGLLEDRDVEVRRMAPDAIARCATGDKDRVDDVLLEHLGSESDGVAAAATVLALAHLDSGSIDRIDQAVSQGPAAGDPTVRFAVGLVRARFAESEQQIESAVDSVVASASAGKVEAEALAWDVDDGAIGLLLGAFNDRPVPAIRLMGKLSQGQNDELALAATFAIGELIRRWRGITPAGVSALASLLQHGHGPRVESATRELERAFPACSPVADQIASLAERATGNTFERAVVTLARLNDPRAYEHVSTGIRSKAVPAWAPEALLHLGPLAHPLLPDVLHILDRLQGAQASDAAGVVEDTSNTLLLWIGTLGESAEPAVPVLADYAGSGDLAAASALVRLGRVASPARDTLVQIVSEPVERAQARVRDSEPPSVGAPWLREHAAIALWHVDGDPEPMLGIAREVLPSRDLLCLEYLEQLHQAAEPVLDHVREQLRSRDEWTRIRAARVVYRITEDRELVITPVTDLVAPTPAGILAIETLAELGGPVGDDTRTTMEEWLRSERRLGGDDFVVSLDDAVDRDERFLKALNDALGV
jgi:hypothetical protein